MKKTVLTLVLALAFMPVFSQATLKHTFTNNSGGLHSVFQNSIHEYVYEILPEVSYVVCDLDEDEAITMRMKPSQASQYMTPISN